MGMPLAWSGLEVADLVAWFNLYVLPVAVFAVVAAALWRGRRAPVDARLDRVRTVRLLGLCHFGLALRALLMTVPEWFVYREAGAFASLMIVNVAWPLTVALACAAIALGLFRLRPWARWVAVAVDGFLSLVGLLVVGWQLAYGAAVYAWDWPEVAAGRILPIFALIVLLTPATARVMAGRDSLEVPAQVRPGVTSLLALAFLVVLVAMVGVNALDWAVRYLLLPAVASP